MVKCGTCMKKRSRNQDADPPDYLTPLLINAPAAWALIRANEIRALDRITFAPPVLDIGCGDGLVTKVILSCRGGKFDWGIDISPKEIEKAKKSGSYKNCKVASVYTLPFPDQSFKTVFSNSVIEHTKDLNKAMSEMSRVLREDGTLIITTPSSYLGKYLLGTRYFGDWYSKFFNNLFNHHHLYTHKQWERLLKKYSLRLTSYYYYHTPEMVKAHELLSYLAIPVHLAKGIFGYWPVFTEFRKIFIFLWLKKLLYKFYLADTGKDEGGSLLITAKKI